jgi:Arc/MetJ-type ribon-helix-helix transcriptional regulator
MISVCGQYRRIVLQEWPLRNTIDRMKTLTVRLPEPLAAEIEAESLARRVSRSDVVRERLQGGAGSARRRSAGLELVDLIGSVGGLPADLSARKKRYLRLTGYGRKRHR